MKTKSLLKKFTVVLALFFGLIGMTKLNAQEFTVGDLNYRINDDGVSVTVTGHVDGENAYGELIIPESVNYDGYDYPVTIIGYEAFIYSHMLTGNINIPNSVTTIEYNAFYYCENFTGLYISASVAIIYGNPFAQSNGLEWIVVDTDNTVYDSRNNCNAIIETTSSTLITGCNNTTIPDGVIAIGDDALAMCFDLTGELIIPNSVITIGNSAFQACQGLTGELVIPNSVTSIGDFAFADCSGFTGTLFIPSSVTNLGVNPFGSCRRLDAIVVDSSNPIFDSRNNCNAIIETANNKLISGCNYSIIPEDIVIIGDYAFSWCQDLTGSLIIPNSVTSIGARAFQSCCNFTGSLVIGTSVSEIGFLAFEYCSGFTEVISLAVEPPTLDWAAFEGFGCTTIIVPCGCVPSYESSNWVQYFTTIIEDCSDVAELDENLASVYPNPTSNIVKIEAENIQNISIYNMLGEMVYESAATGNAFEYDFSNNESGVYLVRIETAQGVVTKRVTVK